LKKRAVQVLPGSERCVGEREGVGEGRRNGPNSVFTYEQMNKEKNNKIKFIKI
jgi:hypothetical protein